MIGEPRIDARRRFFDEILLLGPRVRVFLIFFLLLLGWFIVSWASGQGTVMFRAVSSSPPVGVLRQSIPLLVPIESRCTAIEGGASPPVGMHCPPRPSLFPIESRGSTMLSRDKALVEKIELQKKRKSVPIEYSTVLVIMTHDRVAHLKRTLASVLKARNVEKFQIIVSMDSPSMFAEIRQSVQTVLGNSLIPVRFYEHEIPFSLKFSGVAGCTRHVGSILRRVFETEIFEYLILLEDDLLVAPDFFNYFSQVGPLLHPNNPASAGLFCVSAWNDHAFDNAGLIFDESRVMRTNWYPGLGVMFHKSVWVDSWKTEWPFWEAPDWNHDQWIRYESSTRNKDCIAPQVPRTHHLSSEGLHVDAVAQKRYDRMILAKGDVAIGEESLRIASDPIATREKYLESMKGATRITVEEFLKVDLRRKGEGNFVVSLNDLKKDGTVTDDPQMSRELFSRLGIFPFYLRMFFRGLLAVQTRTDATVFIALDSMKDYWI